MKTLCFLTLLLIGTPAWAVPLTFTFNSQFYWGPSITGSFSYESVQDPLATNVRGLHPNATYALSSYEFSVTTNLPEPFPDTVIFSSDLAGQTTEFCTGICVFSSPNVSNLIFKDGIHTFQLTFGATPDITTWGTYQFGTLKTSQLLVLFLDPTDPTLHLANETQRSEPVPEGSTWLLCLIGFAIVGWFHIKRRVS